jgi:MGT family glycosyltransferase
MSKIAFFNIPAHGHTNPTLGVVKELISRGHEVWYYSYDLLREKIESSGAHFISCDEYDLQTRLSENDRLRLGKDLAFSTKLIVDTTLALDDVIIRDMLTLKPDVIVSDSMAFWGKLIALKLGIPFVSSTTTFAFNRYSSKIIKQSSGSLIRLLFSMPKINKDLNRLRTKGYNIKNVFSIITNDNDTNTIVYTAPEFQPCADTFSDKYSFVGASIRPIEKAMEKPKEKLVYISLGTINNSNLNFYKNCISAFEDGKYSVIISVGEQLGSNSLTDIPDNITIAQSVEQMAVLAVADVFLTHCGMNSVNEALYFGVPMVLFPQMPEQSGVAVHTNKMDAGIHLKNDSAVSIRTAIDTVLDDEKYENAAKSLSDAFRRCSGAKGAADAIEKAIR